MFIGFVTGDLFWPVTILNKPIYEEGIAWWFLRAIAFTLMTVFAIFGVGFFSRDN